MNYLIVNVIHKVQPIETYIEMFFAGSMLNLKRGSANALNNFLFAPWDALKKESFLSDTAGLGLLRELRVLLNPVASFGSFVDVFTRDFLVAFNTVWNPKIMSSRFKHTSLLATSSH